MQNACRYILITGAAIGGISMLYFLSLICGLPFWADVIITAIASFYLYKYFKPSIGLEVPTGRLAIAVFITGLVIITNKVYYLAPKYGLWDAWAIWNLHAGYLADTAHWKQMLLNKTYGHPDYPLALPGILAFLRQLFLGIIDMPVTYAFHFAITLLIPLLIYFETYTRSLFIAGLCLILFATNEFYLLEGMAQMADTLLAFFFLCALVSVEHGRQDRKMLILAAFFLGCCAWTKNEGLILAVIFLLFNANILFSRANIKYFFLGIALPAMTLAIFKLGYAPPNDMVQGQGKHTYTLLFEKERYKLVYHFFKNNIRESFRDVKYGILIYTIICIFRRQWPDRRLVMIAACLLVYMMIYIVSPNDLEWHLFTSQNRLMHQLMPATMYILALKFAGNTPANQGFRVRFFSNRSFLQ